MLKALQLSVNHQKYSLGIYENPKFSWVLHSDKKGVFQVGYQIQIATDKQFDKIVYNSNIINSSQSTYVTIPDFNMLSVTKYFARVKITDNYKETSEWSDTLTFGTALLDKNLWEAKFISAETKEENNISKGTYLRHSFSNEKEIESVIVFATALGLYQLFINGSRVGDAELTPGWTSYSKHLLYQSYDVTELFKEGENVVGAIVGAGWYKGIMGFNRKNNNYGDQAALLCQIHIKYTDGTSNIISSDETWKCTNSPILFSEIYDGEIYDARLEMDGWCNTGFNDSSWKNAALLSYNMDALTSQEGCMVKQIETIAVKEIFTTREGDTVIDFGQNLTGWLRFKVSGKAGERVLLNHFEVLDSQGNVYTKNLRTAKETIEYILKGEKEEVFEPHFTFQGFRYVKIAEYPGNIKPENFTAIVIHSDMEQNGTFECSNPLINQLQHNILWGLKGNFVDIPTDCPQRDERLGWTGDAEIFVRTASYLMDTYTFFDKWLRDVAIDQFKNGGVPHVVPDILTDKSENDWLLSQSNGEGAAAWGDVATIAPWTIYINTGDISILKNQYESMKSWINYIYNHSENGLLWNKGFQFGDWVALDAKEGSYFGATPNDLAATAYYAYSTDILAKAANVLGKENDADKYRKLYNEIVEAFRKEFFTPNGRIAANTQTAHILALHFNLVPDEFRARTVKGLLKLLDENNGHLVTGFIGTPYFCYALSRNGCLDEAYKLLLNEDFPSWLYQVKMGATTVWEHWDGLKPDGTMWSADMNSFNHYAYGAIGEWLYRVVAGIEIDEQIAGYKHSFINPHIGGGLTYIKASYKTPYGNIASSWKHDGNIVILNVTIPHNTDTTIILDAAKSIEDSDGLEFISTEKGLSATASSGSYQIKYQI